MKPSDFQKTVMCRFDSCLKKTVFGVVKDYYKELKKNQAEAICKSQYKNVGLGQYKNVGFPTFLYCLFSLHLL